MVDRGTEIPQHGVEVFLAPHTHWDREWYEPFQRFRLRLVDLLDEVLEQAEAEPRFRFTLDGQMAAVDDYLEVRPQNRDRLEALVRRGQLAVGPWQILMDEFLCSGENIVRNLELGTAGAHAIGGGMAVGHLPDMFGHCAQMPQLLARAGLAHACVWRGVPAEVTGHAFRWVAPDGSSVRAEYLPAGYSNAAYLFSDLDRVDEQVREFAEQMLPWFGTDEVLAMYGTDHTFPIPGLVEELSKQRSGHAVRVGTLAEYLVDRDHADEELPTVRGELRSHARANILPGVVSARTHLKLALRRAERMVERYAEPLAALYAGTWPQVYLDLAWAKLIACACHDSVTGCGADETAVQVAARMAEAEQAGQAVRDSVVRLLAGRVPPGGFVVVNPSPHDRVGWVELEVPMSAHVEQVVLELPDGARLATQELGRSEDKLDENRRRVGAMTPAPPLGWAVVRPTAGVEPVTEPVGVHGQVLDNGLLRVDVDDDGTVSLRTVDGIEAKDVARLVDGGDRGDTYNYAPPGTDEIVTRPLRVHVDVVERGPLRAVIAVHRDYEWPARMDSTADRRSVDVLEIATWTRLELRLGEPFLRMEIRVDNRCRDHRLRLHVPLPRPANISCAEGQFAVVTRPLTAEGGWGETPVPTFPATGFVDAGGLALLLDRPSEYELVDDGREIALTVLRSVGWLSRDVHPFRREPAGPQLATPEAQCLGESTTSVALLPHPRTWQADDVLRAAEHWGHDFMVAAGTGATGAPDASSSAGAPRSDAGLRVEGHGVVMSSLRRRDDWLEIRLVAEHPEPVSATISGGLTEARRCDLLGRPGAAVPVTDGTLLLALQAWEIATLQLRR